jgi:hypothetical protein
MNNAPRNIGYDIATAAGQNKALPVAEISRPITTPFL